MFHETSILIYLPLSSLHSFLFPLPLFPSFLMNQKKNKKKRNIGNSIWGQKGASQQFTHLPAFAEALGLGPSIKKVAHISYSSSMGWEALCCPSLTLHACAAQTEKRTKHSHEIVHRFSLVTFALNLFKKPNMMSSFIEQKKQDSQLVGFMSQTSPSMIGGITSCWIDQTQQFMSRWHLLSSSLLSFETSSLGLLFTAPSCTCYLL